MSDKKDTTDQSSNKSQSTHRASRDKALNNRENLSRLARRFLWADSISSVNRVIYWLGILCAFLFVLDFIVHRHAYAPGEGLPGFYAVVGFVAFTLIVLCASQLRRLILRKESYYSPNSVDAEPYPEDELERLNHTPGTGALEEPNLESGALHGSDTDTQDLLHRDPDKGGSE